MMCDGYRFANPHIITLRRRLATGLARPALALGANATSLLNRNLASCLIGTNAGVLPWLRLRTVFRASGPTDTRGRIAAAKWLNWNHYEHVFLSHLELHPSHFRAATYLPRSCSAYAGRDSLSLGLMANRLRCCMDSSNEPITERWLALESCSCLPALVPLAHQTGIHAIPPCQSSASMLRHLSSLHYRQTSRLKCVLQRATLRTRIGRTLG